MLTRRDKLLNRPWQLRRYNNHRQKVLNAMPAIDFGPPTERKHVTCKLKKLQWEGERRHKIEEENYKLLQRMGSIMKKNRLENSWQTPPPAFLHRVGIYHRTRSPTPFRELEDAPDRETATGRRRGCSACTHTGAKPLIVIPEQRVPWAPPKPRLSRRPSNSPEVKPFSEFDIPKSKTKYSESPKTDHALPVIPKNKDKIRCKSVPWSTRETEQRLILKQGNLQLCVNFPPFAEVVIETGDENKTVQKSWCECKAITKRP